MGGPLPDLFSPASFSDFDTSLRAAKLMGPHLARLERIVFEALSCQPMTAQELETYTSLDGNTIRPRLVALRGRGLVEDSGVRRKTASGRSAVVWRRSLKAS